MTITTSSLLQRLAAMVGLYGGNRDLYKAFGWKVKPGNPDYLLKYRRQDIAKRVINAPVNALWVDPPTFEGDEAFLKAWQDLMAYIPVFASLQRLDKLAGLGRFAIMVVGLDGGGSLDTPVTHKLGRRVLYLQPYGEPSVQISKYEEDQKNPRFGLPIEYTVDPGKFEADESRTVGQLAAAQRSFKVHWSRVLHVAEGALESAVFGQSRLEIVYNVLDDMMKVSGGSAETYWMIANRGLQIDVDKDMELDEEDEEALTEEIKEYEHGLRRVIRTRGVKATPLGSDVADPRGVFDVQLSLLASATGIPKRVLAGSEAGQLASQQDRANWSITVRERITEYGEPVVMLPFIKLLINAGVLPAPTTLSINWPDAFKMNPLERAQTSAQMARSAANLLKALETQENVNQSMKRAERETEVVEPGFQKPGGFFGNAPADPKKSTTEPTTPADPKPLPTKTEPALMPKRPIIEVITPEESRRILGFGKQAPVFDEPKDTLAVKGIEDK